ncbi:MAG TPA: adenylate/guanylate cyclase domain-containing protein, partial [Kofleriaceae bacterium]|nr:adenylate/guanylate cyclase domain-containing protein [Kofleriaceae bacterium]
MGPIEQVRVVDCATARERLWEPLADTNRFNVALGNPPIQAQPVADAGAARYLVNQKIAGFNVCYEERPFEWRVPEYLSITRRFRTGPVKLYTFRLDLAPLPEGGTRVTVKLTLDPRSALVRPIARLNAGRFASRAAAVVARVDRALSAGEPPYGVDGTSRAQPEVLERAGRALLAAWGDDPRRLAPRLIEYLARAADMELVRIRPFELAARWDCDRRELLGLCLEAVGAGLLELSWDIVCPSCRTATEQLPGLDQLGEHGHCQMCDLDIPIELDRAVEAVFRPARAVRAVQGGPYCIGGPFRAPHAVTQAILPGGGQVELTAPGPGRYRLFARGGGATRVVIAADAPARVEVSAGAVIEPAEVQAAPGAAIVVRDAAGAERHVKLEHIEWADRAATAAEVATLPAFRRRFSAQVLRPGLLLSVARAAILFTDLRGSTALYAAHGDAGAYRFIHDHFDLLRSIMEEHGGAVVKTIGDAVMAAFADDQRAVRAAIAAQRRFPGLVAMRPELAGTALRVGVNAGPCFAVTINGVLDYFGMTVNTAERLQAAAGGGEIALPAELVAVLPEAA